MASILSSLFKALEYEDVQRGKTKTGEDGAKTSFQRVPLEQQMDMATLLEKIKSHSDEFLPHCYSFKMQDLAMNIHDYTFGKDTINPTRKV